MTDRPDTFSLPLLPLHPGKLEQLFYPAPEWASLFRGERGEGGSGRQPDVGGTVAGFLRFLAPLFNARSALDLGTGTGYSAAMLSEIVGPKGHVLSVERDPDLASLARRNFMQAGLDRRVAVLTGDAGKILSTLRGPYDLILLDVDKRDYVDLLEKCVDLLAPNGHLVADDVGFIVRDFPPELKPLAVHMARFVMALLHREDLDSIYLPFGDGITISRKKPLVKADQLSFFDASAREEHGSTPGDGEPTEEEEEPGEDDLVGRDED